MLRNIPIKRRLTIITSMSSVVALLLACLAIFAYEQFESRRGLIGEIGTEDAILGDNVAAALAFNDPVSAAQSLKALQADPDIDGAVIYDKDGKVFATFHNIDSLEGLQFSPPPVAPDSHRFGKNSLQVFRGINLAGEKVGTVLIQSDLDDVYSRIWRYAAIAALVIVAASIMAFLLSAKLLAPVSGPISHLAGVVGTVAAKKDYSVRALKQSDDELGHLIDGFNEMLGEIQARDSALEQARGGLEKRVEERTRELQAEIAERREVESALRSSEERFSSAFENASIGMALVSPEGNWLKVNRALSQLVGYSPEELLSKTFQDITHPDDLAADLDYVRKLLAGEIASYQMEKRYFHKLGHIVFVLLSVSLVRDAAGRPLHFISQIQDITKRRRAEAELEQTHKDLIDASRRGGMAEVATNVLHNVGNVLNSVNVSANLVTERMKKSKVANLAKAASLLREHEGDLSAFLIGDSRGRQLPTYLARLAEHLTADQDAVVKELELLGGNIDHIKEIVAMQQSHAKMFGVTETLRLSDVAEESLRMNTAALHRHRIEVLREFEDVPPISMEKHKVLQILVNLVRNAKHACDDSGRADKRMTVRVANSGGSIKVSVSDNGVGIAPENLARIFNHGFTTRKEGHGFGLHSGALAAKEMGGSLSVRSDGPGKGATFTLELPLKPGEQASGSLKTERT